MRSQMLIPVLLLSLSPFFSACTRAQTIKAQAPKPQAILKIGADDLKDPQSLRTAPNGDLIVLDRTDKNTETIYRYTIAGAKVDTVSVPTQADSFSEAFVDSNGTYYLTTYPGTKVCIIRPGQQPVISDMKIRIYGADLKHIAGNDWLYLLGDKNTGLCIYNLKTMAPIVVPFKDYPDKGTLSHLHIRSNGDIYAYSDAEEVVWHLDRTCKFVESFGGAGPHPPKTGMPADFIGTGTFDVDDNGDIYWTLADYGALLMYTADGKLGVAYHGQEAWNKKWTGPLYTLRSFTLSGDYAGVLDAGYHRITLFPKSIVAPGSKDCSSVDARAFGYSYSITSATPYKLFTTPQADLQVSFERGNRRMHAIQFSYKILDMWHNVVDQNVVNLTVPGANAQQFPLPAIVLPKLGWYEMDSQVLYQNDVIVERIAFLSRTMVDDRLPIPAKESTGWTDMATHAMIGMGLARFTLGQLSDLDKDLPDIAQAKQLGIPYFIQISNRKDATPAGVKYVLDRVPDCPILEIVNEPNLQMSADDYVALLRSCYQAAHQISPNIKVMGPAQCGISLGWLKGFFKAGGGPWVDIVSVHSYERNNSMDAYHWSWKFQAVRDLMAANGCGNKPLYQTEHGFLGDYHGLILRPRWQAFSVFMEDAVLDRVGVTIDKNYYYYDNQGGFADFSSFLVNDSRELYPAALIMRTRAHFLKGLQFAKAYDLGSPGNWLALVNRYNGQAQDVVMLVNCGAYRPVDIALSLPDGAHAYDCFGNEVPIKVINGHTTIPAAMYPTYVVIPHNSPVTASVPGFGANVTSDAVASTDDPKAAEGLALLTNHKLEFDFEDEPIRQGMASTPNKLPMDLVFQFKAPQVISRAVVYASMADNMASSPMDYTVQVQTDAGWQEVDTVDVFDDTRKLKLGNIARISWYDNPWIFVHSFAPVKANAIRFHFTRTTEGQYTTHEANEAICGGGLAQQVVLREVQIFAPPAAQ